MKLNIIFKFNYYIQLKKKFDAKIFEMVPTRSLLLKFDISFKTLNRENHYYRSELGPSSLNDHTRFAFKVQLIFYSVYIFCCKKLSIKWNWITNQNYLLLSFVAAKSLSQTENNNLVVTIGSVVAVLFILAILVGVVCLYR